MLRAVQVVRRRRPRPADPDRPSRVIEQRDRALRPAHPPWRATSRSSTEDDPRYRDLLDRVPPPDRAQGGVAAIREDRNAPAPYADRRDDDAPGRRRRHALRHASARTTSHRHYIDQVIGLRRGVRSYAAMNAVILHGPHGVHRRHLRQRRPDRRADRRDHAARGRGSAPLRHHAESVPSSRW